MTNTSKKDGGTIEHWQLHTITSRVDLAKETYPDVDFKTDKVYVMTGTVVEDPTGRWLPGYHMKSSLIVNFDEENGIVETMNTIYHIVGEQGDPTFGGKDIGSMASKIFY